MAERESWRADVLLAHCARATPAPGGCGWCGAPLPPRRSRWCGDACSEDFWRNHWWTMARRAAKRRDRYACVRCGHEPPKRPKDRKLLALWRAVKKRDRLEVNHKTACEGRHASLSCSHHLDNLETLCVPCHAEHTRALRG